MKPIVYIDGREGTTGLEIQQRLAGRGDIALLSIDREKRKDPAARKECLNSADLVFLCLPDEAAREAVSMTENPSTRIIDASTAHRVDPAWVYGFPELSPRRQTIAQARYVTNPGCHATGFLACVRPLVEQGILPDDYPVTCFSLTGYSGGGKKMIAEYENGEKGKDLYSPRVYGLDQAHKHLPEMQKHAGLKLPPVFSPVVDDYYRGMATTVMLHSRLLEGSPSVDDIRDCLTEYYRDSQVISVARDQDTPSKLASNALAGSDRLELFVCGGSEQITVTALFDNLGKGASGAAVQNMNLMLGLEETAGLNL